MTTPPLILYFRQTAGFFQALAANTTVQGNVVLNGPRSGLNFNDAAFGGNDIRENLLANLVRETVDHGPYNSWDRNPYIWRTSMDDEASATTYTPAMSSVHHNFIFCSYGGIKGIDHDDGSGYYYDHDNFLPYCTGKMKGEAQTVRWNVFYLPLHFKRILLTILTCPPHILTFKKGPSRDTATRSTPLTFSFAIFRCVQQHCNLSSTFRCGGRCAALRHYAWCSHLASSFRWWCVLLLLLPFSFFLVSSPSSRRQLCLTTSPRRVVRTGRSVGTHASLSARRRASAATAARRALSRRSAARMFAASPSPLSSGPSLKVSS